MWWNIWDNQILSWSRDRNIGYLSIYCSCWNTLKSILRTPLYMRYLVMKYQYHSQNAIKDFIIPGEYNKDNAYWADLFTRVKSCNKKIGMDMIYLPIFNFWVIYSWWYIRAYPESCKIIHQVSVQTLVCLCLNITSCKIKIVHFKRSDMDI